MFKRKRVPVAALALIALPALALVAACGGGDKPGIPTPSSPDASITWTQQLVPSAMSVYFEHIACAGESHCVATGALTSNGVAIGPAVLTSANAGQAWAIRALPPDPPRLNINTIACIDDLRCVALADRTGSDARVLSTIDGGMVWSEDETPDHADLTAIACAREDCMAAAVDSGKPLIFRSADGGLSWSRAGAPDIAAHDAFQLTCPTAEVCYLTVDIEETGHVRSEIYATEDGGGTWTKRTPQGQLLVFDVTCLDTNKCLALRLLGGAQADIVESSDGGRHWTTRQRLSIGEGGTLSCGPRLCVYAGDENSVISSEDGGITWRREVLPVKDSTALYGVSCALPSACVAAAVTKHHFPADMRTPERWEFEGVILTRSAE